MNLGKTIFFVFSLLLLAISVFANDFSAEKRDVLSLGDLVSVPSWFEVEEMDRDGDLKAIYYDALPWKGKSTRVFAWLGMPNNANGKVPGVVLVHGGGGSAFKEWVKLWNDHGFAAISIAVEGQTDQIDQKQKDYDNPRGWIRHPWAGPRRSGIYGDSDEIFQNQWIYHAVADTILANSLLRSLPEVDENKVGLTGISWGGVITSTVMGIDLRFAFAIPVYGCGHLSDAGNQYSRALGDNDLYKKVWDPMVRMNRASMPALWLSWPGDKHFPLDSQAACYNATPGPHMLSLIPGMKHGHAAGWNPPDSYAFAESVVNNGSPWCLELSATLSNRIFEVEFSSSKILQSAVLISTVDTGFTGNRKWVESPASIEAQGKEWIVKAPVPKGSTAWFMNVTSGHLTASSDYQESLLH